MTRTLNTLEDYLEWLNDSSIREYFEKIFPDRDVREEKLDSGLIVYSAQTPHSDVKTHRTFYMYYGAYCQDFYQGLNGDILTMLSNFAYHKHNRRDDDFLIKYFNQITGADLTKEGFEDIDSRNTKRTDLYAPSEICDFTLGGLNNSISNTGLFCPDTLNYEPSVLDYYKRNFDEFKPDFQQTILTYMPTIRVLKETAK